MGDATVPKPWISFDLGAQRNLAYLHVWNYNEAGYNQSRTIKTAEIFTSADTTPNWVSRGKYTYAEAPVTYGYLGEDIPFPFADVRMVKVQALTTGGDGLYGLSKVRFACAGLLSFGLPDMPALITGTAITWAVPSSTNVQKFAPTFTLSAGSTAEPVSGTVRDFTTPQAYTVIATLDKPVTTVYTVTIIRSTAHAGPTSQTDPRHPWSLMASGRTRPGPGSRMDGLDHRSGFVPSTVQGLGGGFS